MCCSVGGDRAVAELSGDQEEAVSGAEPGGGRGWAGASRQVSEKTVSGIGQAISASAADAVEHAARLAHAAGRIVVYDPNLRARLTSPAAARAALERIAPHVSVAIPSYPAEARALLGADSPEVAAEMPRDEANNDESPTFAGLSRCAEEGSNLHPVIPDQALNLVTRMPDMSEAWRRGQ
jgi:hypothetical protein